MARGSGKNASARNERLHNLIRNNKHSKYNKNHLMKNNYTYSKKQMETILFSNFHDRMLFYKKLTIQKQVIFCNCVQHIINNVNQIK